MTQREESDRDRARRDPNYMSRWRGALMASLPAGHPVHDPQRAFTYDELEGFERELFDRIEGRR